jgi:hypothetical protein
MNWLDWLVRRFFKIQVLAPILNTDHGDKPRKPGDRWGQSQWYDWSHQGPDERKQCKYCDSTKVDDHMFSAYIMLSQNPCAECKREHDQQRH